MYQLFSENYVLRVDDGAYIPLVAGNRDYQQYQQWLEEGNTPAPAPTPDADEIKAQKNAEINEGIKQMVIDQLPVIIKAILTGEHDDLQVLATKIDAQTTKLEAVDEP